MAVEELAPLERTAADRLRMKHFAVDKRTEIPSESFQNLVEDPSSLLRRVEYIPSDKGLMDFDVYVSLLNV